MAIEEGIASKRVYEQLEAREKELAVLQQKVLDAKLSLSSITEQDVISFLTGFRQGNVDNGEMTKMIYDTLIHQVFISELDNKKEIIIVCNVHNHNLDFINDSTSFGSSFNSTYGGADEKIDEQSYQKTALY